MIVRYFCFNQVLCIKLIIHNAPQTDPHCRQASRNPQQAHLAPLQLLSQLRLQVPMQHFQILTTTISARYPLLPELPAMLLQMMVFEHSWNESRDSEKKTPTVTQKSLSEQSG